MRETQISQGNIPINPLWSYIMKIGRKKLNLEILKYLKKGGKITKLPDGPDYRFQPYGVRVASGDPKVDLTISDSPTTKQQISYVEKNSL